MNKKTFLTIALCVAVAFLVWNNLKLVSMTQQLSSQLGSALNTIHNTTSAVERLSDEINTIKQEAEETASLFSKVETHEKLVDNAIELTLTAVPKELSNDETMSVVFEVNEKTINTPMTDGKAIVTFDITDRIEPIVVITSPSGTRQQALDTIYFDSLLMCFAHAELVEQENGSTIQTFLDISIKGDFNYSDIKTLEVIAEKHNHSQGEHNYSSEPVTEAPAVELSDNGYIPNGQSVESSLVSNGVYRVEITEFVESADEFEYKFYVKVTLTDGTTFIPLNNYLPIADVVSTQNPHISTYGYIDLIMQLD